MNGQDLWQQGKKWQDLHQWLDHVESSSGAGALWQDHWLQGKKWQDHHQWLDHAESSSGDDENENDDDEGVDEARVCTDKGPTTLNSS